MKRRLQLLGLVGAASLALMGTGAHASSDTRTCPFPVVGGDPDFVQLAGPATIPSDGSPISYTVTADESPGEGSHVVTLAINVSSDDGGTVTTSGANTGNSPTVVDLTLAQGHHYTIDWAATFDFGIHPCSSAEPGQSAFDVTT